MLRHCLFLSLLLSVSCIVLGIDLGSEFVKGAIVKPGSGLDIVLNEQTKRKTVSYVGFRNNERYFGEDAYGLHTRFPSNMLTFTNHLAGLPYNESSKWSEELLFPYFNLQSTPRDSIAVEVGEKEPFNAEELLGMYLRYMKVMAETHAEIPLIKDCVISIPASWNIQKRQALLNAAELAGLDVLTFIHHTVAAALEYGVKNRGFKSETNIVVFDMGSSRLEVGVFTFLPQNNTKAKKEEALGTLIVRSIESDPHGGRHYDALLARHIAAEFKSKNKVDVLSMKNAAGYKAVAKLMRSAQNVKETLSANKDSLVHVEGIYDDRDFHSKVSRQTFEGLIAPLIEKAMDTVSRAIEKSGLTWADISSIELMGGGSRVPILQTRLQSFIKAPLGRTLNTDEAIVQGAAFHGARLSGSFRVRSFSVVEPHPFNITFALSPDEKNANPAPRPLFINSKTPSRKQITVFRDKDFSLTLFHATKDGELKPITEYSFTGVSSALKKLGVGKLNAAPTDKHSIEIKVRLSETGAITIESATAIYEETVNITKRVKVKTNTTAEAAKTETEKTEKTEKSESETPEDNTNNETATNTTTPKYELVNSTKVEIKREVLEWKVNHLLFPKPMSPSDLKDSNAKLTKLRERDAAKREIAEAKNELASFIMAIKYDQFFDDESLKSYYNDEEAESIRNVLTEVETWLEEGDGIDATAKEYKKKLKVIKDATDPIYERRTKAQKEALLKKEEESKKQSEDKDKKEGKEEKAEKKDEL